MNQAVPTISVITATFNAAKVLPSLIESLRAQSDRNFEWVVADGASNDGTVDILRNAGDVVSHWISEPDFGIYDALNKAVKLATGEYYLVVGADDTLFPDAMRNFLDAADTSKADIVAAQVKSGERIHHVRRGPSWLFGQFSYVAAHAVGTLFRRQLHERFGYYSRRYPIAADALFIKKACQGGATVYAADFVAGEFGQGGTSSVDVAGSLSEFFRVQLETESKLPQLALYALRLIKNYRRL
jgi:glycosyltransferase involved in cell wall biosynthesis